MGQQREKRYVPVVVRFDTEGNLRPLEIEFDEAHKYPVDKVLDVCRAALIVAFTAPAGAFQQHPGGFFSPPGRSTRLPRWASRRRAGQCPPR